MVLKALNRIQDSLKICPSKTFFLQPETNEASKYRQVWFGMAL